MAVDDPTVDADLKVYTFPDLNVAIGVMSVGHDDPKVYAKGDL